jgi:ABC-type antimicrobial peptide transport system permease subunit
VYDVRAMQERVDDSVGARRLATATFGAFAAVALVLAALGVYGVLSYVTAQRTRELGVRAAFGARGADLERMVLAGGARLAAAGVAGGALLFLALRRGLSALLYGVGPTDPVALGAGVTALAAVVLLASWLPARRAARADPAQALRAE